MHLTRRNWLFALQLTLACSITWFISSVLIYGMVETSNEMLGSMWAVIATIFVLKESHTASLNAGLVRIAATLSSVAVCFVYFLFLPFHPLGMVLLIGAGYLSPTLSAGRTTRSPPASPLPSSWSSASHPRRP